jgi:hypothetical protein
MKTKQRKMRLVIGLLCAALSPVCGSLFSQENGVIEGRLVNGTDPARPAAKISLEAISPAAGMNVLKTAETDTSGRFRLEGLPTDQPLLLRATYKSVNYNGQVVFDAGGKATMDIKVYEPTASMAGIQAEGVRMAFQLTGDHLESMETVAFNNQSNPPRTFTRTDGAFRFAKAPGLLEPPRVDVIGPGSTMPVTQSALESADGKSYYTLYPLRPGVTTFEIQQQLPYTGNTYTYRKTFFHDVSSYDIGVIPADMALSGENLKKVQTDTQRNFAVYSGGPIKSGAEVVWNFRGGTPVPLQTTPDGMAENAGSGAGEVKNIPDTVGLNALILGPLLLIGFLVVLWYGYNQLQLVSGASDAQTGELRRHREQLLNFIADLDVRRENNLVKQREYVRQRESGKRQLRRIAALLKK